MNTKNILLTFIVACLSFSCQDLDQIPPSYVSGESYWKVEDDAIAASNGLYSRMRGVDRWCCMYWFECRSGNIAGGMTSNNVLPFTQNNVTSNLTNTDWAPLYKIISQANAIMMNIDKVSYKKSETRDQILAQAYFFRAWSYFQLVRLWGEVPIVTNYITSDKDPQLFPSKSAKGDIWELIIADIEMAESLYKTQDVLDRNKVSRAAILMLRADIYLWTAKVEGASADLDKAEKAVDEVLSMSSTFKLLDSYVNVFEKENNEEIIFALNHNQIEDDGQYGLLLAQSPGLIPKEYQNNPVIVGNGNYNFMQYSNLFYQKYRNKLSNDSRAKYISDDTMINGKSYRWTSKFMGEYANGQRYFTTDTRYYRFAEAILFKAEILAERNNASAVEYLNKTIKRATGVDNYYPASLSGKDLKDAILDERMIEFAGEMKSWFDLIRFGEVFTRVPDLVGREDDKKGNVLYLPIYNQSLARNPNLSQTEGYN